MSRNAFDQMEREYNEREEQLANCAEERKKEMSPRHNVGSVKDPHWVVDEEHYLKAVAQRDKAVEMLRFMREEYASLPLLKGKPVAEVRRGHVWVLDNVVVPDGTKLYLRERAIKE